MIDLNLSFFVRTSSLEEIFFQMLANRWFIFPYKNVTKINKSTFRVVPFRSHIVLHYLSLFTRYLSPWDAICMSSLLNSSPGVLTLKNHLGEEFPFSLKFPFNTKNTNLYYMLNIKTNFCTYPSVSLNRLYLNCFLASTWHNACPINSTLVAPYSGVKDNKNRSIFTQKDYVVMGKGCIYHLGSYFLVLKTAFHIKFPSECLCIVQEESFFKSQLIQENNKEWE